MNNISIKEYNELSDEDKENFYKAYSNGKEFIKAIRLRKTKNMKKQGYKQPNGNLTFVDELKRIDKKTTNFYYLCKCDCGNWYIIENGHFEKEDIKSCGCLRKERGFEMMKKMGTEIFIDIKNNIYGDLKVLKPINRGANEGLIWECECVKCGQKQNVLGTLLRNNHRRYCAYCNTERKSIGEQLIKELLNNADILYQNEKTFDSCKFPETNKKARFDFYVNNQYIIEFDGEQHYHPVQFPGMTEEESIKAFLSNQLRDNYKNQWCKNNNIPLIRIPYTHLKDICLEDLIPETSDFLEI